MTEVYLSTHFKNDLEKLPLSEQKRIAEIIDLLEKDPIANSHPSPTRDSANSAVREVKTSETRIVFRHIPEESAVILTGLYVGTLLSDDQMFYLAQSFHDLAIRLGQLRLNAIVEGHRLAEPVVIHLQGSVNSLLNIAAGFAIPDANLRFSDRDNTVSAIRSALSKAEQALEKTKDLDRALNIASSAIILAMAISIKHVGQILKATNSLNSLTAIAAV